MTRRQAEKKITAAKTPAELHEVERAIEAVKIVNCNVWNKLRNKRQRLEAA